MNSQDKNEEKLIIFDDIINLSKKELLKYKNGLIVLENMDLLVYLWRKIGHNYRFKLGEIL